MNGVASLVDQNTAETIEVLGPTIQYLTPPDAADDSPCVMRGTIPPGVVVPLHSHSDPETFLALSGEVDGLSSGALTRGQFEAAIAYAGLVDIEINETHCVHEHAISAIVRARKPA